MYHQKGAFTLQEVRQRLLEVADLIERGGKINARDVLGHIQATESRAYNVLHKLSTDGEVDPIKNQTVLKFQSSQIFQ